MPRSPSQAHAGGAGAILIARGEGKRCGGAGFSLADPQKGHQGEILTPALQPRCRVFWLVSERKPGNLAQHPTEPSRTEKPKDDDCGDGEVVGNAVNHAVRLWRFRGNRRAQNEACNPPAEAQAARRGKRKARPVRHVQLAYKHVPPGDRRISFSAYDGEYG